MSFFGKLCGGLAILALAGSAAYLSDGGAQSVTAELSGISMEEDYYILREHEGKIALFRENSDTPEMVYSTPLSELNPADAALLGKGIRLKGLTEVARLLEDLELEP